MEGIERGEDIGWPVRFPTYSLSKVALNAYTRLERLNSLKTSQIEQLECDLIWLEQQNSLGILQHDFDERFDLLKKGLRSRDGTHSVNENPSKSFFHSFQVESPDQKEPSPHCHPNKAGIEGHDDWERALI